MARRGKAYTLLLGIVCNQLFFQTVVFLSLALLSMIETNPRYIFKYRVFLRLQPLTQEKTMVRGGESQEVGNSV